MVVDLSKRLLGCADFRTKTISVFDIRKGLYFPEMEKRRLVILGEKCISIAQIFGGEKVKGELEGYGFTNYGGEYTPAWNTDVYWFFGILGGLEIHADATYDGIRGALVWNNDKPTFEYTDLGTDYQGNEDQRIMLYNPGEWEDKINDWYKLAKEKSEQKIIFP